MRRLFLSGGLLVAGLCFLLPGCSGPVAETAANPLKYDSAKDGVPEIRGPGMGGAPGGTSQKGKGKGKAAGSGP